MAYRRDRPAVDIIMIRLDELKRIQTDLTKDLNRLLNSEDGARERLRTEIQENKRIAFAISDLQFQRQQHPHSMDTVTWKQTLNQLAAELGELTRTIKSKGVKTSIQPPQPQQDIWDWVKEMINFLVKRATQLGVVVILVMIGLIVLTKFK